MRIALDEILAVGREHDGRAELAQLGEQMHEAARELVIEVARGLVAQQEIGPDDDGAGATAINWRWPIDSVGGLTSMAPERPSQASISETKPPI